MVAMLRAILNKILEAALYKTAAIYLRSCKPFKISERDVLGTIGKFKTNSCDLFYKLQHTDTPTLSDQQKYTFICLELDAI